MLKVLNLRNVPEELMRELKAEAALADEPFHPFCVALIKEGLLQRRISRPGYPFRTLDDEQHSAAPTPEPPQEIEIT